jgi:hypothetical protein
MKGKLVFGMVLYLLFGHESHAQNTLHLNLNYQKPAWTITTTNAAVLAAKMNWDLKGSLPDDHAFSCLAIRNSPGGRHFQFQQTLDGLPVHGSGVLVTFDHSGKCMHIAGPIYPIPHSDRLHTPTDLDFGAMFERQIDPADSLVYWEKCWFFQNEVTVPAYKLQILKPESFWELVLSDPGQDTLLLTRLDVFHHHLGPDTTGNAWIFDPDPLTTAGTTYGGNFTDNFDSDHPDLNAQRHPVTLQGLGWNGTHFLLSGPHIQMADFESPNVAPPLSTDGNFQFTRSQQGFEDVMVYHHIDSFQRYVQGLGFNNLLNAPVPADAHGLNGQDNSHFVPVGANGRLAFGEGGVDDAEDADVILHEYSHALSYAALRGANTGTERNGLDEGLGDYFAASYSKSKSYNLWKNTYTWDGHNEFWGGRNASTPQTYPPPTPNIYTYGEIWASTLMEVYETVGRQVCDRVLLQAMYTFAPNIGLEEAAQLVLDADTLLYGGSHSDAFRLAFCRRGIFTGAQQGQDCFVSSEEESASVTYVEFFPNPTTGEIRYRADLRGSIQRCVVTNLQGVELMVLEDLPASGSIDLKVLPSGTYLVRMEADRKMPWVAKIHRLD